MSVFKDPQVVREGLDLPGLVDHSFVGTGADFEARLEAALARLITPQQIRHRAQRPSSGGRFVAYKYQVHYERFEEVEAVYAAVSALEGVKFVI
ncbi:DUF493 family protein [Myxococcota bacterium]|nr:DUF493 family protein [Myxococcota bacterium]MBU1432497.1 DUF493 family protein [Myxococcota bacterium]MBU1896347.1 DUF493 family protein [Myxococcota bacterium]